MESLKTCYNQNNAENRVQVSQASMHILEAYFPVLKNCLKKLTRYLRENAAYPKDINHANNQGATVLDIFHSVKLDKDIQTQLQTTLTDMKALRGKKTVLLIMPEQPVRLTAQSNQHNNASEKALRARKVKVN